jgi:hypothetical protein
MYAYCHSTDHIFSPRDPNYFDWNFFDILDILSYSLEPNSNFMSFNQLKNNLSYRDVNRFGAHRLCKRLKFYKIFVK